MASEYGHTFDNMAHEWAVIENHHDEIHPDRNECGGVGGCSLMLAAAQLEQQMVGALDAWRTGTIQRRPMSNEGRRTP